MLSLDSNTRSDGLVDKLISLSRTATTVKGGRVFSFAALTVIGDGNGRIGFGRGKAPEPAAAMQKASEQARKNMISVELKDGTLWHEIIGRHGATKVLLKPASEGTGIIAGGATRAILEVVGVKNVLAKTIGSSNPNNVLRATLNALTSILTPDSVAAKRGKSVENINN